MKKLIIAFLFLVVALCVYGQETKVDEQTLANMSFDELQAYQKVLQAQKKQQPLKIPEPDKLQQYAEVGKAFGTAFKECWSTVSVDAERFAQSPAGKWAMVLVSWKIMGQDAIDITENIVSWIVGIGLLAAGVPFWIYIFNRNCVSKKILLSKERTGLFTVKKTYSKDLSNPIHGDEGAPILYAITFAVFIAIVCLIMFVG